MSRYDTEGLQPRAVPPSRRFRPWRAVFLGLLLIVGIAAGAVTFRSIRERVSPMTVVGETVNPIPSPESLFHRERIYALLLGIDYNYDSHDYQYSNGARSDTIMAVALDLPTKHIDVISVPRDMDAEVKGHEVKINEAYADGGVKLAQSTIGQWLGMPQNERGGYFDRYLVFKVDATKELIDAIGGIDLKVSKQMDYDDSWGHLHIHFKPGYQHLNGPEAVAYSRFRHDETGDIGRIARQQQVVRATINKLKSDKLNDLMHIGPIIGVFNRNVITNLTNQEKESLAFDFAGVAQSAVKFGQVPYVDTKTTYAAGELLIPDEAAKAKLVAQLVGPIAPVETANATQLAAIEPATVHVDVENGSGRAGMAARMAGQLRKIGFVVESVGNAPSASHDTTVIETHSRVDGVGEKLRGAIALPGAEVSPQALDGTSSTTDATIIVGRDYVEKTASLP